MHDEQLEFSLINFRHAQRLLDESIQMANHYLRENKTPQYAAWKEAEVGAYKTFAFWKAQCQLYLSSPLMEVHGE